MKKLLLTIAALPVAAIASQASAQTYASGYANTNASIQLNNRIANLETRLSQGYQMRALDRREHAELQRDLVDIRQDLIRASNDGGGLTATERRNLQARIRMVRNEMRVAGGAGWANRYGWDDRDLDAYGNAYGNTTVRYDAYGRPIPNSGVVYDQYGRPVANQGYYGSGGPYEPVYAPRSNSGVGVGNVLGGVLGNVVGGGGGLLGNVLGGGGLGVGSVITSAIANVLRGGSNYGYRDTGNTYFRSDGQRVYEIDARTNTVVRIHPLR
jgi:hypothetical protein